MIEENLTTKLTASLTAGALHWVDHCPLVPSALGAIAEDINFHNINIFGLDWNSLSRALQISIRVIYDGRCRDKNKRSTPCPYFAISRITLQLLLELSMPHRIMLFCEIKVCEWRFELELNSPRISLASSSQIGKVFNSFSTFLRWRKLSVSRWVAIVRQRL